MVFAIEAEPFEGVGNRLYLIIFYAVSSLLGEDGFANFRA